MRASSYGMTRCGLLTRWHSEDSLSFLLCSSLGEIYGRLIRQLVEGGVGTRHYENVRMMEYGTETDYVYLRSYRYLKSHNRCTMVSSSLRTLPRPNFAFLRPKSQLLRPLKPSHLIQKIEANKIQGFKFRSGSKEDTKILQDAKSSWT